MIEQLLRFELTAKYDPGISFTYAPLGWNECEFELRRDPDVHGVFELSNVAVRFHDGYKNYILTQYNAYGVDADVRIQVIALLPNNSEKEIYRGILDFTTLRKVQRVEDWQAIEPTQDDYLWVECDIIPDSPAHKLRERAGIDASIETQLSAGGIVLEQYNMPYKLPLHSQAIFRGGRARIEQQSVDVVSAGAYEVFLPLNIDAGSDAGYFVLDKVGTPTFTFGSAYPYNFTNPALPGTFELRVRGTITYSGGYTGAGGPVLAFAYILESTPPPVFNAIWTSTSLEGSVSGSEFIDVTINVSLNTLQHIWIGFVIIGNNDPGETFSLVFDFPEIVTFTTPSLQFGSFARSWLVFEALQKSIDFCTDKQALLSSSTFGRTDSRPTAYPQDGRHSLTAIANGLRIRDLIDAKAAQFSYKKLFDSLNACFCIGWGERRVGSTRVIDVETRDYFYQADTIARFTYVKDITVRAAQELYYQRARFGFQKFEISETNNSLDEFCTQHNRYNVLTAVPNEYIAVSDFIASGYAIERLRRIGFEGDPTKGDKYDEDNFFITVKRGDIDFPFRSATNEEFESVTGIISPSTRYNLRLSPARNFTRHLKWLNASLWKMRADFAKWVFGSGQGNLNLSTRDVEDADFADTLAETQDISLSQSDPSIFYPEFIEFSIPLDLELWATLIDLDNKYKAIEVSNSNSNFLKGWLWSLKIQPQYPNGWAMNFTLLSFGQGYDFAENIPPSSEPPPPANEFGLAYIANTFAVQGDIAIRGVFGTLDNADLSQFIQCGENLIVRWFNNGNLFTESMTVSPRVIGEACGPSRFFFTAAFANIAGTTQLNGINMKIRVVSTGQILKFGHSADDLVPNP